MDFWPLIPIFVKRKLNENYKYAIDMNNKGCVFHAWMFRKCLHLRKNYFVRQFRRGKN